jgi:hypothetical protein
MERRLVYLLPVVQALKVVGQRDYALLGALVVVSSGVHDVAGHGLLPEDEAAGRSWDAGSAKAAKRVDGCGGKAVPPRMPYPDAMVGCGE